VAIFVRVRQQRRHEAERRRDADGRRAPHRQRRDGIDDLVERTQVALDVFRRQPPLVDDAHRAAVVRPAHRSNGLHAYNVSRVDSYNH